MNSVPHVVFKLKAYSGTFLNRTTTLEDGDKIVLHQTILDQVMSKLGNRSLPHPMIWELRNVSVGKVSHCGVLEFSATEKDHAFLPKWMMENMFLEDGSALQIKLKPIPKASMLKLEPKETEFLMLPDPKSSLEYALRKFTAVTQGDAMTIKHGNKQFHFKVLEVQPNKFSPAAVCVIDTKVSVEFAMDEKLAATMGAGKGENASLAPTKFALFDLENPAEGTLQPDSLVYFRFKLVDPHMAVEFSLLGPQDAAPTGELYVSATTEPAPTTYTWTTRGNQQHVILIEPDSPDFSKSWYFLALEAGPAGCDYTLKAREVYPKNLGSLIPGTGSNAPTGGPGQAIGRAGVSSPSKQQTDSKLCDNCQSYIPNKQYMMHSMRCARINVRCDRCKCAILRTLQATHMHCPREGCNIILRSDKEIEVHLVRQHTKVTCNCGEDVTPSAMGLHQAEHCGLRIVACKYCSLKLPFIEQAEHMDYCGSKSSPCPVCDKPFPAKRMASHLAVQHRHNPSLQPGQKGYVSIDSLRAQQRQRVAATGTTDKLFDLPDDYSRTSGVSRRTDRPIGQEHVPTEQEEEEATLQRALQASQASHQAETSQIEEELLRRAIAESKGNAPDLMVDEPSDSPAASGPSPMQPAWSPNDVHTSKRSNSSSSSSSLPPPAKKVSKPAVAAAPPPAALPVVSSHACSKCPGVTFSDFMALVDHEMEAHG
eukprot:gb/GEZN01002488.1/.p1 GENE.gb/GEZN01002488.1/~~gb/GEZN01002488.1/.p1  ORF type:complete len:708 (-),score=123.57 gb/GEZN01002488.1/:292-2415(-)